jgi:hypothetical protein
VRIVLVLCNGALARQATQDKDARITASLGREAG